MIEDEAAYEKNRAEAKAKVQSILDNADKLPKYFLKRFI